MKSWLLTLLVGLSVTAGGLHAWAQPGGGGGGGAAEGDLPPMLKNPRLVSGQARPEQGDPRGRLTVRAVQGSMRRTEFGDVVGDVPSGAPIHLVAIDRRGRVSVDTQQPDDGGRVTFENLATDGSVSYWVMSIYARGEVEDRLVSRRAENRQLVLGPVAMLPEVGMRMMLAGLARSSTDPPVDDLLEGNHTPPPPGEVVIDLDGDTEAVGKVELLEVGSEKPVAVTTAKPAKTVLSPEGRIRPPASDPAMKDGLVEVRVERKKDGIGDIAIEILPAADAGKPAVEGAPRWTVTTDASGRALFEGLPVDVELILRATVQDAKLQSRPFKVAAKGGTRLTLAVDWLEVDSLRARFTGIPGGADKVYVARVQAQGRVHLSAPFQLTRTRGAVSQILVFAGVAMSLHGGGLVDDETLWFQVQFTIYNPSVIPYDPGTSGLRIPLPKGFFGAGVADEMTARVKVDDDVGFVWRGVVPPGQRDFTGGFNLPIEGGTTRVSLPLPYGTFDSRLVFEDFPGARIDAPLDLEPEKDTGQDGRALVIFAGIHRRPGSSLEMTITGLPQHAPWKKWGRRAVAVVVLGMVAWLIFGLVVRARRGGDRHGSLEAEREELLQDLVQLEADHRRKRVGDAVYHKGKADLMRKLEGIYAELGAGAPADRAGEGGAPP